MPKVSEEYLGEKKKLIVQAATTACIKKTVCSITMQDVINESGLSQGGIYRFYQSIDDILIEVLLTASNFKLFDATEKIKTFKTELDQARKEKNKEISKQKRRQIIKSNIIQVCTELSTILEKNLHPFFSIHFGFSDMVLNYPERAKYIFSKAKSPFWIENEIKIFTKEIKKEISDNVFTPRVPPEELIEFLRTNFLGITQATLVDERYLKDIMHIKTFKPKINKKFLFVQKSAIYLFGLENV